MVFLDTSLLRSAADGVSGHDLQRSIQFNSSQCARDTRELYIVPARARTYGVGVAPCSAALRLVSAAARSELVGWIIGSRARFSASAARSVPAVGRSGGARAARFPRSPRARSVCLLSRLYSVRRRPAAEPSRACAAGESEAELGVAALRGPGSAALPPSLSAEREDYARALRPELTVHTAGLRIE
ncbi:hypothetical protein SRHO_G00309480 [Serrasalmus rhombeus]